MEKLDNVDMAYGHKSYEGTFEIAFSYPSYFESNTENFEDGPEIVTIMLHCYVIGPNRHYKWYGHTIEEAVTTARKDIERWVD